jgi:hypothetical protein
MENMLSDNQDLLIGILGAAMIYAYAYWYYRK